MVNKIILIGNVGKDPEIKTMNNGNKFAKFSLATSESWRDKESGERKTKSDWHHVVVFQKNLVEIVEKYVKKGSKLYIEGSSVTREWTDKNDIKRYITEVNVKIGGQLFTLDKSEKTDFGAPDSTYEDSDECPF